MTDAEQGLIAAFAREARGPRRNGLFALWLVARAAEAVLPPDPVSLRGHRRRVETLRRRLARLAVPLPLRRAMTAALRYVNDGTPQAAALAMHQLVAPARETVGTEAAEALAAVAARARASTSQRETA